MSATDTDARRLAKVRKFSAIVEEHELHGLSFQHLSLCTRRAWLHLHRLDYAHLNERMKMGSLLHEASKSRDGSVEGLLGISPDRIDWKKRVVFEAKGGAGAAEAVARQCAFYALMLWAATGLPWTAAADILPSKRIRNVEIDDQMIDLMVEDAERLAEIKHLDRPPDADRKPICSSCSYRHLCGH